MEGVEVVELQLGRHLLVAPGDLVGDVDPKRQTLVLDHGAEIVLVDVDLLALRERLTGLGFAAGEVAEHEQLERELDLLLSPVRLLDELDVHSCRRNLVLEALTRHNSPLGFPSWWNGSETDRGGGSSAAALRQ